MNTPTGMTLCSGIGAPEMAAPFIDWRFASEIEPFPRAVLQARFGYRLPEDHNQGDPLLWGDMTDVTPDLLRAHGIPVPDILVAGTPCQAFSVAGRRDGTADPRGALTLKFVELVHDLASSGLRSVLWENVPGVLSDKSNAFGCLLGGLVGADDALDMPGGGSWPNAGMVAGPRARAAWRVLDAQHFGVPQRRRRVFLVVDLGTGADPVAVLFERKGVPGHPAPGRKAGEDLAGSLAASLGKRGGMPDADNIAGGLIASTGDIAHPLGRNQGQEACIAFSSKDYGADAGPLSPTLRASGHMGSHPNAGAPPAIAIQERAVSENPDAGPQGAGFRDDDMAFTLEARNKVQAVAYQALQRSQGKGTNANASKEKTDARTLLRRVRAALGEEAFAEWGLGISDTLQPAKVLRQAVHGRIIRPPTQTETKLVDSASSRAQSRAVRNLREMRSAGRNRRPPPGSRLSEQLARELGAYLSKLPQSGASSACFLHDLWQASQGLGVLREALSAIQEAWQPAHCSEQAEPELHEVRPEGPCEGPVRHALHASEKSQYTDLTDHGVSAHEKGGGGVWAVRRLTPRIRECHRLQGFPDDHCDIPWRGKAHAPDGPQYKALGNSMAVPNIRWILRRMVEGLA